MKTLKAFFAFLAVVVLIPQASAQSATASVGVADPTNGNKKAGYGMKLSSFGAWPGFGVGVSEEYDKHEVSVFGNRAFVLTMGDIAILDISDPAKPVHIGGFSPGIQSFVTFASDGRHIYGVTTANHSAESDLEIWDVTDGAHPAKTGSLSLGAEFFPAAIRVAGPLVFLLRKYEGSAVKIIDVSDPIRPRETAGYRASGEIHSMAVAGDKLLVASGGLLDVIDISAPASPKLLGSLPASLSAIEAAGNTAFIAGVENDGSDTGLTTVFLPWLILVIPNSLFK